MSHPYIYPSRALVYRLINQDNGTHYNPTDVVLQNLRPYSQSGDVRNTALDVVGVEDEGMYGSVTVYYRRIDVAQAFIKCDLEIHWNGQSDTLAVMQAINALYGTKFDADDVEIAYFNPNTLPLTVNVQMRDSSLAWTGSVPVRMIAFTQTLTLGMQQVVDPVFDYPTAQSAKAQGPLYLRPYDFDTYWTFLKDLGTGLQTPAESESIRALINTALPATQQWVLSNTAVDRNLTTENGQLNVLYNGKPISEYTHRLSVGRIMVVTLSDTLCANVFGYLVLHFSDPSLDLDTNLVNKDIGKVGLS